MANKFTNFIFTTEGKDTITQVLAAKKVAVNAQLSINTVYTFSTKLSTSLVYTQISSLGPKQTKPIGTVTPQDNDTVEMRIQLDNVDLTAGYNLQGVAIVGQYNGNSFVLGYINANETTNIPPYDGTQVQTVALDVSFAISDTNIVTINTQTAGMLTVDDYNALVKLLETRVAPLAVDSTVVHLTGSEVVTGIKQFTERIVGSVTGNAHTADYLNVHNLTADISLDTLSDNGSYLSKSNTKVTTGKPSGTSELYTLIVAGTMQLFNDMSNDALYVRNRIDSKTMTSWKKIVEDVDQTLNAKYNYAQLPTVNGSGVALQSDLAAETSSRSVADRDLKASIALEAQTRSAADIAFGSSLTAEVAARSTADASVTAAITKEQATRSTADASITANLMTETSARSAADTSLQALYSRLNSDFNDEIATRSAADSLLLGSTADLASQIAKERDNRVFNDNSLASDIASNATKRDELFGSMLDWNMSNANSIAANSVAINSVNAATVHLSGSETITGQKNFKGTQSFENLSVSGYTDVFGPLTAKGDFWVNGSWNGENRKLNTVYNTDPQISYNAAAKAVGWGNSTGSTQLIRIKNGWVSIYIAFTTNKPIDYGIATEIGKITNKDFPLPWGTGSAYGTAIDITTSAFVGTLIIDTSGVLTINMSSGTMPAGEYLTVNAQYAY